jgi:hypothetical protein
MSYQIIADIPPKILKHLLDTLKCVSEIEEKGRGSFVIAFKRLGL